MLCKELGRVNSGVCPVSQTPNWLLVKTFGLFSKISFHFSPLKSGELISCLCPSIIKWREQKEYMFIASWDISETEETKVSTRKWTTRTLLFWVRDHGRNYLENAIGREQRSRKGTEIVFILQQYASWMVPLAPPFLNLFSWSTPSETQDQTH